MKKYFVFLFVSLMFVGFLSSTANASLIADGGFESGYLFNYWSCTGTDSCYLENISPANSGLYSMRGYDNDGYATLSQAFATTVGASYDFSFFTKDYGLSQSNALGYSFSGYDNKVAVLGTENWTKTFGNFVAAANTTSIEFYFSTVSGSGTWGIDDVSVTPSNAVPEPASMLLLGLGLMGLAGIRRKLFKK